MAIKSVKSEGPPPSKVAIAYNGSQRFIDAIMAELQKEWQVANANWVYNAMMPLNSAIIYDRYDNIAVNEINNQLYYRKITKEERDAAFIRVSSGRVQDPFQDEIN